MSPQLASQATSRILADLLHELGDIPPTRIRLPAHRGVASEQDILEIQTCERRLYELVDGFLVEKPTGYRESVLAVALAAYLHGFVFPRKLGLVSGEAGMVQLFPGLIRIPDVAFVSWKNIPDDIVPMVPVPKLVPDLAVEILSEANTPAEMERKRREYFDAGVQLVWIIDPEARTVLVYSDPTTALLLTAAGELDGGDVLPGFRISLAALFANLDQRPT